MIQETTGGSHFPLKSRPVCSLLHLRRVSSTIEAGGGFFSKLFESSHVACPAGKSVQSFEASLSAGHGPSTVQKIYKKRQIVYIRFQMCSNCDSSPTLLASGPWQKCEARPVKAVQSLSRVRLARSITPDLMSFNALPHPPSRRNKGILNWLRTSFEYKTLSENSVC